MQFEFYIQENEKECNENSYWNQCQFEDGGKATREPVPVTKTLQAPVFQYLAIWFQNKM